MCTTCGCAAGETRIDGEAVHGDTPEHGEHWHVHADGTAHAHPPANPYRPAASHRHAQEPHGEHRHAHGDHGHADAGSVHYGHGPAGAHAPGMSQSRMVQIERDILSKNDDYAAQNRARFDDQGIFALNLVSSPGSGKTTLLCRTIEMLKAKHALYVIEGDQQTSHDAERIRATGAPALQINTGKGCHLDAHMIGQALTRLAPADGSLLFIENVGNLVCPAAFDLGEAHKVAILSVTEGEDKPLKYPDMFRAASLMLVNKIDLLPYVNFKLDQAIAHARRVNPQLLVIQLSATSGEGFAEWLAWIEAGLAAQDGKRQQTVAALRQRIAALEAQLAGR
ncbi:MAG TPA: hydrogenase nickel incorporation protein HypB [Azospira sp.]|nr:hydrogenase nickel incorporation protein HypB [Azospira sp.]